MLFLIVTGERYGHGFYFGKYASTSYPFCVLRKPDEHVPRRVSAAKRASKAATDVTYTMMLCKLIIGSACLGAEHMTKPPPGFDSCRNGARDYYVIFYPEYILPVAIIEYTMHRDDVDRGADAFGSRRSMSEFKDDSVNKETIKPSCSIC